MQISGPTLKALREASGLSQLGLSERTDPKISQGRISEIESAPVTNVRPATAKALAAGLGVPTPAITVPESDEAVA